MRNERGFTLIELLVVIVILGILAAVVVFAVGGLSDSGNDNACKTDTRTIRTAQEAYASQDNLGNGEYGTEQELVDAELLESLSTLHQTAPDAADPTIFTITVESTKCGEVGEDVDTDPADDNI
ncbi:MAG: type II secretion system protein [Acidimicrobiales bacterium]|nr:type II secretion system protein [Acidimicrobiales bacterium]